MRCIRCLFDAYRSSSGASEIRRHPREGGGGAETLAASPAVSPTLGGWCGAALVAGHLPHVHLAMASMTALLTRLVTHLLPGIHHDCRTTFATPLATARVARRTTVSRAVVCSVDKTEQLGKAAAACDEASRPHALPAAAEFFATDTWMGLSTPGGQWRSLSVAIAAAAISCAVRVWNQTNPHL